MITDYKSQINYLRELARELVELTLAQENDRKRKKWANHNDLLERSSPLLWVCPDDDGGWMELLPKESLECEDDELRDIENKIKKYLYQGKYLKDNFVFESRIYIPYPGTYTGYLYGNTPQKQAWGVSIVKPHIGDKAYHLDNFLKTPEDYEALLSHDVDFIPDELERKRIQDKLEEALGGILEIEFQLPYSVLVQSHLIELVHLRGLENLLYDVYDEPELLQAVLGHMGESKARLLKKLEAQKLLFDNRINIYTGSGSLGYTNNAWKKPEDVLLTDMWGFADAQEFSCVSPQMFEEFAILNQKIGLNLFGRGCYGCCEALDKKYDAIYKHITNIRKLSVSPWANIDEAVEKIGQRAIFSWKPNPIEICTGFDEVELEKQLKEVAQKTKDCYMEIILKDIRTCRHTNEHLVKFIHIAKKCFEIE